MTPGEGRSRRAGGNTRIVRLVHAVATGTTGRRRRWTPVGLTLFGGSLAVVLLAGLATDRLLSLPPLPGAPVSRGVGIGLLLSGLGLCAWCVGLFVRARGTPVPINPPLELIQRGPYAWVRNPMLTGVFAALFGTGLLLRSPSVVLLWTPAYVLLHVLELRWVEEPELERRFGVAYRAYRDAVPMFLPLPRTAAGGRIRLLPPVCALAAAISALGGRLRFHRRLVGIELVMADGGVWRVFRHLSMRPRHPSRGRPAVLVVRFRFARLSRRANRLLSLLPVPVIGGFPGFRQKLWMADDEGWWQGVYEWESAGAIAAYRASPVFRAMQRRAAPGTLSAVVVESRRLDDWVEAHHADAHPGPERRARSGARRAQRRSQRTSQ